MRTVLKYAAALSLTGAVALAAATPSQARWHHGWHDGWHNGGAVAAGIAAGALVGAAAASSGYYYGPGDYAYEAGPGYYGPRYRYYYPGSDANEWQCTVSPASGDYVPCSNN